MADDLKNNQAEDPQDVAAREHIFKRCDTNGDGKVSVSELGEALKMLLHVTPEEVTQMMNELDINGDGYMSYEEFLEFAREYRVLIRDVAKML